MGRWLRAVSLAMALALVGGQAQAKWLRAETKHFVLYSDGSEGHLRAFAAKLEVFDEALRFFHPVRDDLRGAKLDIYLLKDHDALTRIWRHPGGVAGFYSAGPDATLAVALRDDSDFAETVLFHEYTHHFMLRYFAYPYPGWLIEGWAEYFGSSKVYPDRIDVGLPANFRGSNLDSWYISSRDLFGDGRAKLPDDSVYLFYSRAWLLTHFMMGDDTRRQQLNRYMRLIGEGKGTIPALEEALGYDMATLDKKLREYLKRQIPYTTIKRKDATVPMTVTVLSPAADDILLEKVRLLTGVSMKDSPAALKYIEFRAKGNEGDRLAQLTLARAHIMLGDPAAAEPILAPYIADPDDAEALLLMGLRYSRMAEKALGHDEARAKAEKEWEERKDGDKDREPEPEKVHDPAALAKAATWYAKARPWLAKANIADPESYETLYAFAQSRAFDPDYPTERTLDVLAAAYERAPQVDEITMANAKALIARDRPQDATTLLRLLANDPHGGTMAKRAKAMLDDLAAHAAPKPN
jgi:tetratricopeptide (TPR) repeat protein